MSSNQNDIKQRQEEERKKQDARDKAARDRENDELLAARLRGQAASAPTPVISDEEEANEQDRQSLPVSFQASVAEASDWQKIMDAYKERYDTPIENNRLVFPTREDAVSFFKEQASAMPPRKFLAREIGADGNLTGFNVFSCGNGELYQGSLEEIQQQLQEASKANPNDENLKAGLEQITAMVGPNPAQSFKERMSMQKSSEAGLDANQSAAPSPLGTTPKPGI